jgi:hypothetical protein
VAELATERCIVLALGSGSTVIDAVGALDAIEALKADRGPLAVQSASVDAKEQGEAGMFGSFSGGMYSVNGARALVDMAAVLRLPQKQVPWQEADGHLSGVSISVYPPGIPALLPGEVITSAALDSLRSAVAAGATLVGCSDDLSDVTVCT